jgi:hypothetical protein
MSGMMADVRHVQHYLVDNLLLLVECYTVFVLVAGRIFVLQTANVTHVSS